MNKHKSILKRFKNETNGNVSVMFAVSFLATFTIIGAALDLMLLSKSQQKVQYITDAAALAALQFPGTVEEKKEIFNYNIRELSRLSGLEDSPITSSIEIGISDTAYTLDAQVEAPYKLTILDSVRGDNSITIKTSASLGIEDIEIALVLDISSSMAGARIEEARKSTIFFIDQLLEDEQLQGRVSISLVPFGGMVRVPEELHTLLNVPLEDLLPSETITIEYTNLGVVDSVTGLDDESFSDHWIDGKWNQCFEFDVEDIEKGIDPDGSYRPIPDFYTWNSNNPWCPRSGSELVPLTNDADILKDKIETLTLSDGTGSGHGMAWGFEVLNPDWRNRFLGARKNTPSNKESGTKKVIVFMSDGGITAEHHVREQDRVGDVLPYYSKRKSRINFNPALNAYNAACDRAKDNDIEVYTIGYSLGNAKQAAQIKACATSESHYIDAFTGDLENVFGGLAASISPLRLSN